MIIEISMKQYIIVKNIAKLSFPGKVNLTYVSGKENGHTCGARTDNVNKIRILHKHVSCFFQGKGKTRKR